MTTAIERKHALLRQNGLDLGALVWPEEQLPDGGSRAVYALGRLYYHPRIGGAFGCSGPILERYRAAGEMRGQLGYPIADEEDDLGMAGGRCVRFEGGTLRAEPNAGVRRDARNANDPFLRPHVIVKISDALPLAVGAGKKLGLADLATAAGAFVPPELALIEQVLPDITFGRAFEPVDPQLLVGAVEQARKRDPDYAPPLLENFLQVDCPIGFDTRGLADLLGQWAGVVEFAHAAGAPSDPQVVGTSNPLFAGQHHLNAAPEGIGVQAAWDRGLDGAGVMLVDVEQGWFFDHEDLPTGIALIDGVNRRESFGHGTAVLSTVAGVDSNLGGVGIAPFADVRAASYWRAVPESLDERSANIAGAISNAVMQMPDGSILLIEAQVRGDVNGVEVQLPTEVHPAVFQAIRLATALGVIVIEAAGNGGVILDDYVDRNGRRALSREAGPEFADSGAIMVGACEPDLPHRPDTDVNVGSRVDCCAWGSSVLTAGGPLHTEQTNAYFFFGGTSAASAIIAGVALLVQQMMSGELGRPLTPAEMRRIVSDAKNGTETTGGAADRVGVMPDLAKIVAGDLI